MNRLKSLLFIVLLFAFGSHAFAQCGGSYFKTGARALLPPLQIEFTGDFNGDGKLDLLGGNPDNAGFATSLLVVFGNGDGTFGAPFQSSIPVSFRYLDVQIADINSDGKDDVFINRSDNTHVVYRSNGNGTFTALAPTVLTASEIITSITDVNNDGRLDMFSRTQSGSGSLQYRLGNADGSFGNQVLLTVSGVFEHPGDFNNDGKIDFPLVNAGQLRINYNDGNGNFTQTGNLISTGGTTGVFALRDFNNDGKLDAAMTITLNAPWKFIILFNNGNNNFTRAEFPVMGDDDDSIFIGDFDGDNAPDFLDAPTWHTAYAIWKNNGAGVFEQRVYNRGLINPFSTSSRFLEGKFDADGKTDLIRINSPRFGVEPRLFNETQVGFLQNVCNAPGQTKIVDFDRDSMSDLTVWRESDGRWRYRDHGGIFFPTVNIVFNWGTAGDIPAPGDFDGDGMTDYAVYRPSNGVWYIRNSSDESYYFRQFGLNADKPVAADYNGDGRTDIAVYRPSNGNWYVLFSGSTQYYIAHFGIAEDKPVQEDYDGDGKTDLAVYRPSTGVWYYLRSSDGSFAAILWGNSSDLPAPGDYDGDGKGDFCLFRPSTGDWHVRRSYNLQTTQIHFGLPGDVPQGGDWDGDGISDLAVYRPGNKVWYMQRSGSYLLGETGEIPVGSIVR